jgi:uncharacterized protein (TIGR02611 family)
VSIMVTQLSCDSVCLRDIFADDHKDSDIDTSDNLMKQEPITSEKKPSIEQLVRKAAVAVSGSALIIVGIPLIPLPGPGCLVVAGGLSVLASEFPAAQKVLDRGKETLEQFAEKKAEDDSDELGLGFTIVEDPAKRPGDNGVEKLRSIHKNNVEKLRLVTRNHILPFMNEISNGKNKKAIVEGKDASFEDKEASASKCQDCGDSEDKERSEKSLWENYEWR